MGGGGGVSPTVSQEAAAVSRPYRGVDRRGARRVAGYHMGTQTSDVTKSSVVQVGQCHLGAGEGVPGYVLIDAYSAFP